MDKLQSDAGVKCNSIAVNTDANLGNLSYLTQSGLCACVRVRVDLDAHTYSIGFSMSGVELPRSKVSPAFVFLAGIDGNCRMPHLRDVLRSGHRQAM